MPSALFLVLMAGILISKGQVTNHICVPKGTNYFLNVSNNITLNKTACFYYEEHVFILMNSKEGNVSPSRLAAIPLQELKTQSSIGVITNHTKQKYQLGKVSFSSMVNNRSTRHDQFELHSKLEILIPEAATNHPLLDEIYVVVRCLSVNRSDVSSLGTRHEAGHYRLVYYINETSEGPTLNSSGITQASQSLSLPANSSPDPGSSEEKKSLPGEGPTSNSTGISTQASQSLGLPVTPSPDPGSSQEKNNFPDTKRKTDKSGVLYGSLAALFLSLVTLLTILILSRIYRRSCKVSAPGEP